MSTIRLVLVSGLLALAACSSTTEPNQGVTALPGDPAVGGDARDFPQPDLCQGLSTVNALCKSRL
ncbi:MAG TPA: hypothetical protein VFK09_10750 [Gemmatimonadales bacterium]|jgi:hypothetical protein|nr:hypothetical protein [Gemmatimonadales bacterium]